MPLVIRNENIDKLMSLKFAKYENDTWKKYKTHYKFRKVYNRRNDSIYYDLCEYANEPTELISKVYILRLLATHRGCLMVDKVNFGGWRWGDFYLLLLMKNGLIEFTEDGKTFKKCFGEF